MKREGLSLQAGLLAATAIGTALLGLPPVFSLFSLALFFEKYEVRLAWMLLAACTVAGLLGPFLTVQGLDLGQLGLDGFVLLGSQVFILFGGFAALSLARFRSLPAWKTLVLFFAACFVLGLPFFVLSQNEEIASIPLRLMMAMTGLSESDLLTDPATADLVGTLERLMQLYAVTQAVLVLLVVAAARAVARWKRQGSVADFLAGFRLPAMLVWAFIVAWAAVLFGALAGVDMLALFFANIAIGVTLLYGLQGLGVAQVWLRTRGYKVSAIVLAVLSLLVPPVFALVIVLVPVIGLSEIWIDHRSRMKEKVE